MINEENNNGEKNKSTLDKTKEGIIQTGKVLGDLAKKGAIIGAKVATTSISAIAKGAEAVSKGIGDLADDAYEALNKDNKDKE